MKAATIQFKGQTAAIEKHDFYCKAGEYTHKDRAGWVLVVDGKVVLGDRVYNDGGWSSAHEWPEFKTRKALLADAAIVNAKWYGYVLARYFRRLQGF